MSRPLTAEILRAIIDYDPSTGVFTRKVRTAQRNRAGDRADRPGHGRLKVYRQISYKNEKYMAHRLAWFYVYGVWPRYHIDHINGIKSDNRIANLRDVDQATNVENQRRARKDSQSGLLGAHPHQGRWRARLHSGGREYALGYFDTPQEAHDAYVKAKRKMHKGCTL